MSRKIPLTIITLTLFLITASTIVPSSNAVEWSGDIRLTIDDDYVDSAPSIAQAADGNMWVVWSSYRTDNNEIFYSVYDGSSWSEEAIQLTNNSHYDSHPAIMRASNDSIWVVWDSDRNEQDSDLYCKVYNGSSWCDAIQLTTDFHNDRHPAIMEANSGDIWVVWDSDRNEQDWDLYCKVYNGSSWSNDVPVPTDPDINDQYPSIMQATGGMVWVVFTKVVGTNEEIYYKLFDGTSWSIDVRLTWHPGSDLHPSITQASDGAIWVMWDSDRDNNDNIYYKFFDTYWRYDKKLTTDLSEDFWPSITQAADGTIWVVWTSTRLANFDIYYKTTVVSPYHDIAVIRVTANPTIVVRGENVSIEVVTQNQGTYAETFEVQCHANLTLIGSTTISLSPGQTNIMYPPFQWNTTGFPRGTYIISATVATVTNETDLADNSRDADEPVEVRILGDICGMYEGDLLPIPDGVVNLYDLAAVAMLGPYSSEDPTWDPVWGPVCDVNKDGKVDEVDLIVISIHFGET